MNIKLLYGIFLCCVSKIVGIDTAKKFDTQLRFHKKLNLKNPSTLSDKVTYIELHAQSPLASLCTDKYEVRNYIKSKGLADILVPLVGGVWDRVEDIKFAELPDSFALKATHGCKMNYLVPDKKLFDEKSCKKEIHKWLKTTYGTYSLEPHYISIPHRIFAEKYLGNTEPLIDYKFHCLNGIPQFILACSDRKNNGDHAMQVTLDLFDTNWHPIFELKCAGQEIPGNGALKKPEHLEQMVRIATILSQDFTFVRVDLYELRGVIYFGELTFSPACCVFPYFTDKFDLEMGRLLSL